MRISYSCPAHLKFAMTIEQWTELVNVASECIDWLDAHEGIYDSRLCGYFLCPCTGIVDLCVHRWTTNDFVLVPYICPS